MTSSDAARSRETLKGLVQSSDNVVFSGYKVGPKGVASPVHSEEGKQHLLSARDRRKVSQEADAVSQRSRQQASSLESRLQGLFVPPQARLAMVGSIRDGLRGELNQSQRNGHASARSQFKGSPHNMQTMPKFRDVLSDVIKL